VARPEQIEELAHVVLTRSDATAVAYVDSIRLQGMSVERIYLDLISPVARHLGDLWLSDVCGFTDVTVGLWRLQHVARNMSPIFQLDAARGPAQHQALLVPLPGEQHTFGLYLVAEFFRRAGWNVSSMPLQTCDELVAILRGEWFSLVGLSLSCESRLDELASKIRVIRRASCNQGIGVMVGGAIFIDHPEWVVQVGADMMAIDGRQAPAKAQELVTTLAVHQ
jgi:methanogenic corrinoid protein MtbC1